MTDEIKYSLKRGRLKLRKPYDMVYDTDGEAIVYVQKEYVIFDGSPMYLLPETIYQLSYDLKKLNKPNRRSAGNYKIKTRKKKIRTAITSMSFLEGIPP